MWQMLAGLMAGLVLAGLVAPFLVRRTALECAKAARARVEQARAEGLSEGRSAGREEALAEARAAVVPVSESQLWSSMDEWASRLPMWPRVFASDVWTKDLQPAYKAMLAETIRSLVNAADVEEVRLLQCRAILLQQLIEQPGVAVGRLMRAIKNEHDAGRLQGPAGVQEGKGNG